jgi:hypothetical protein
MHCKSFVRGCRDIGKKVAEQLGGASVSQGALRKSKHVVNRVIPNVRQHGRLKNLCYQRVERV